MSTREDTTFRLQYAVGRDIAAPVATVWARLTDAPGFTAWNSTVSSLEGEIALGQRLKLQVPIAPGRTFKPKVVAMEDGRTMVWQDGFFPMFQGTRTFTLSPTDTGTRFEMVEVFRGMMLPMIKGSLPDFRDPFDQFAADLATICEADAAG